MSAINTSLAGMLGARDRFEASAKRIVTSGAEAANEVAGANGATAGAGISGQAGTPPQGGTPPPPDGVRLSSDMAGAMIDMLSAEHSFKANAAAAGRIAEAERDVLETLAPTGSDKTR